MARPRLLELCSKAGGSAMGFYRAGFDVVGVDKDPQRHFPFTFHLADALEFFHEHAGEFDAYAAGPPCQRHSTCQRIRKREHPDLIADIREAFTATGKPWVIENVNGAPLMDPLMLCGASFNLGTYRHRFFESPIEIPVLPHPPHTIPQAKMGRPVAPGHMMHVVGNFSDVRGGRQAMGIDWMTRDELREAIPPAYTEYVGRYLLEAIKTKAA